MKKAVITLFCLACLALPVSALAQTELPVEPSSGDVLCPPGLYIDNPGDCLALGPSQTIAEMASEGFSYPLQPFLAVKRDDSLGVVPFLYYKITEEKTNTYSSLDAAIAKTGALRQIGPGALIYLTYIDVQKTNRGTYILLPTGEWMPGAGTRVSVPNLFQGLQFSSTPKNPFGWVILGAEVRSSPGYAYTIPVIKTLEKHALVQIYQSMMIDDAEWYLVGPDEWVEARKVGVVFPNPAPPQGITGNRWIDVDLAEQTLAVYENGQMIFASLVATGIDPFWTRPGLFQIYKMKETENMSGAFEADRSDYYYLENVPYTLYFDKARAIHGAYWRTSLGYPQSHGCVNMSVGDAAWLFQWAKEGDWVHVHDRNGITPTDPSFYGDGGA